mgnify:CR=1 FL=1
MRAPLRAVSRRLAHGIIRGYQIVLSPWLGANCRYHPTCSQYALEAIERALDGIDGETVLHTCFGYAPIAYAYSFYKHSALSFVYQAKLLIIFHLLRHTGGYTLYIYVRYSKYSHGYLLFIRL